MIPCISVFACSTIHGTGTNTRNYLYVADVTRAFDLIFHKGVVGEVYNIGSSTELSNMTVARDLLRLMGKAGTGMHPLAFRLFHQGVAGVRFWLL